VDNELFMNKHLVIHSHLLSFGFADIKEPLNPEQVSSIPA